MASKPLPPAPERPETLPPRRQPPVTPPSAPGRPDGLAFGPERPDGVATAPAVAAPGLAPVVPVSSPAPVERPTPDPTRRLARGARALWTLEAVAAALPVLVVAGIASVIVEDAGWAPDVVLPILWIIVGIGLVVRIGVVPQLRWRHWRYEVRESEIDLRRGAFTVRRTLVPMSRVQHVDTRRTVLSELFGLAAVVFHTAAGANEIPALTEAEAAAIRDSIADLAAMSDDPV